MFTELVESTKQKKQGRSRFYLVTSLIYGTSLSMLAVATIVWFNPAMAEATTSLVMLPPVPVPAPPPDLSPAPKTPPAPEFMAPKTPPKDIIDAAKVPPKPPAASTGPRIVGAPPLATGTDSSMTSGRNSGPYFGDDTSAPPPPPPPPAIKPTPTPEPTPGPTKPVVMSTGVLHGKATHRPQPPYPQIAKAIRASGTVPVQITISEEGRVISAQAMSGHPALMQAAQQAAMQWVFTPTVLSGKPVKVTGVISFNFILN